jgi:hypothetical protein
MAKKGLETAADLVDASNGRLSERTCYRIVAADGRVSNFSAVTLEALCDMFGVTVDKLLTRE